MQDQALGGQLCRQRLPVFESGGGECQTWSNGPRYQEKCGFWRDEMRRQHTRSSQLQSRVPIRIPMVSVDSITIVYRFSDKGPKAGIHSPLAMLRCGPQIRTFAAATRFKIDRAAGLRDRALSRSDCTSVNFGEVGSGMNGFYYFEYGQLRIFGKP